VTAGPVKSRREELLVGNRLDEAGPERGRRVRRMTTFAAAGMTSAQSEPIAFCCRREPPAESSAWKTSPAARPNRVTVFGLWPPSAG
jgi:hypothetical protein